VTKTAAISSIRNERIADRASRSARNPLQRTVNAEPCAMYLVGLVLIPAFVLTAIGVALAAAQRTTDRIAKPTERAADRTANPAAIIGAAFAGFSGLTALAVAAVTTVGISAAAVAAA
jgi:hypothetical protein